MASKLDSLEYFLWSKLLILKTFSKDAISVEARIGLIMTLSFFVRFEDKANYGCFIYQHVFSSYYFARNRGLNRECILHNNRFTRECDVLGSLLYRLMALYEEQGLVLIFFT